MSRRRNPIGTQRRRTVSEAVAAPERTAVAEAGTATVTKPGRMLVRLITAGWSLNGNFYPAEVLKRDGATAWPKGTHAFVDHATEDEDFDRPSGSIKNLAAVLEEDARWDEGTNSLVAEVRLFASWRETLTDMADAIGMSIRAYVTAEHGERDGRSGTIVNSIEQGRSVDFVTVPAAGGEIINVLESAQGDTVTEARTVGTWLESRLHLALTQYADDMYGDGRLTRAERITLSSAIGDGLQAWTKRVEADAPQLFARGPWDDAPADGEVVEALADDTRARLQRAVAALGDSEEYGGPWVHDFDPDEAYVIYASDGKTWRQSYTTEGGIALTGEPVEVARSTAYVPVTTTEAAPVTAPVRLSPLEVAEDLARADQALQNSPTAATANAEGSPPAAVPSTNEGRPTMSGSTTAEGAQPNPAGTQNGTPVAEEVAVVAAERDQYRARLAAVTESLTEAQSSERTMRAERDQAVARALLLEGNEAGRIAVDAALAENANIPESMYAAVAPRVHDRIRGRVPMTDDGKVNTDALEALITTAIKAEAGYAAQVLESQGVGSPSGLGGGDVVGLSESDYEAQIAADFEALGLPTDTAKLAAKGR